MNPDQNANRILRVSTESGAVYRVDLVRWRVTRYAGTVPSGDPEVAPSARLRRDGDELRLIAVRRLQIGVPAVFVLEPLGGAATVATTRTTTFVTEITDWTDTPDLAPDGGAACAGDADTDTGVDAGWRP